MFLEMLLTLIGILIGVLLSYRILKRKTIGALIFVKDQTSSNEQQFVFLELSRVKQDVIKKDKYVVLKVKVENYASPRE